MIISAVVAASQNGVIGKNGGLPWHLPSELARFKKLTMGAPIIMGRKTHESIGRALPGRENIIITRDTSYKAPGCIVVNSLEDALKAAKKASEIFIIGGASIYEMAMPKINKIYLTKVNAVLEGDRYFKFDSKGWEQTDSEFYKADTHNPYSYEIQVWERK